MGYRFWRGLELALAAAKVWMLRIVYGSARIAGPCWGFGSGLSISIRKSGRFEFGSIIVRRNLSVFCDDGTVSIGRGVFFNNNCSLNAMARISIGEDTLFGEGVKVYDHDHVIGPDRRVAKAQFSIAPVSIGNHCWIGSNAVILKGVTLCDGVTIGAGAIVTRSIDKPGIYVAKGGATLHKIG
ncbi:MAG TPA: acyltransferase [Stenotrophomonas sp.]|jgi:acetyltransferase-like isoleucine patch superfamily enzyme